MLQPLPLALPALAPPLAGGGALKRRAVGAAPSCGSLRSAPARGLGAGRGCRPTSLALLLPGPAAPASFAWTLGLSELASPAGSRSSTPIASLGSVPAVSSSTSPQAVHPSCSSFTAAACEGAPSGSDVLAQSPLPLSLASLSSLLSTASCPICLSPDLSLKPPLPAPRPSPLPLGDRTTAKGFLNRTQSPQHKVLTKDAWLLSEQQASSNALS